MNAIQISLSDSQRQHLDRQIYNGGYSDANEYIQALIEKDRIQAEQREVEQELIKRLQDNPLEMTQDKWNELHQRCRDELNQPT